MHFPLLYARWGLSTLRLPYKMCISDGLMNEINEFLLTSGGFLANDFCSGASQVPDAVEQQLAWADARRAPRAALH